MSRLSVTPQQMLGAYPSLPISADGADFVFTAAGASFADGASFAITGKELLLVHNGAGTAQTVTISSVADEKGRTGDISAYSVGAGEYAAFGPFKKPGWAQAADGNKLYFAASNTAVEFAVLRWT